jgi:hypothetical protein
MSRIGEELRDPWGALVGGVAGGLAWAVGAAIPVAGAVALAVYGVKVALGAAGGGGEPELPGVRRPHPDSAAGLWLRRGESAVRDLGEMARETAGGASPADDAAREAASEAEGILASMRRLGSHVVTLAEALARSDAPHLDEEAARLRAAAERYPDDVSARRSADAVADRLAVRDRLRSALAELEGRLQSSALGLEGLVARVAEVRATAASVGTIDLSADSLAELTSEVEGLRQGLAAAERVATRVLAGPS